MADLSWHDAISQVFVTTAEPLHQAGIVRRVAEKAQRERQI